MCRLDIPGRMVPSAQGMHTTIGGVPVRRSFLSDRRVSAPTILIDDPVQLDESSKACLIMMDVSA